MDIYPADPHDSGSAIARMTQIASATSSDFTSWGVAKGAGVDQCGDVFGDRWALYKDGARYGLYFCIDGFGSEPDGASDQLFEIKHTTCPQTGQTDWVMYWNGSQKTCHWINGTGGVPDIGGESLGYDPQNIDVHFQAMKYRVLGGTWTNWTTVPTGGKCVNAGYSLTTSNGTTDWTMEH